jgi:hypothetical protein
MDVKRFVPYEKLSKKRQREIDREKRGAWGAINPVTRRPERPDAYDRQKENRRWKMDARQREHPSGGGFFMLRIIPSPTPS